MHLSAQTQVTGVQLQVIIATAATGDKVVSMHHRRWAVNLPEPYQCRVASK